ncbi:F-box and leucine-rich repeat protein 13-like [Haemaphysalis longicornis]
MWTSLTVLNLSWCPCVGDRAVDSVTSTLPNLEELYISGCWRVKNSSMALVASRLRKLKLIEMDSCRIGNDGLRQLSRLSIAGKPLDDELLPQLEHISTQSSPFVNHTGLLFLRTRMQHLTTLNIAMSASVQDRAVYEIADITTLKHLDMHGCRNLTARSIWELSTGSLSLTYLDVSYCPHIGDDAMEKVLNGPGLHALSTLKVASTSITDRGLTIVALTMKSLTSLDASSCNAISKQGIEAVCTHLENLRAFHLRFCKSLHNDALLHLSRMASLQVLNLKGCRRIGSRGMKFLASGEAAANVLELDVGFTSVDDFGLKYIAEVVL